jgi:hypothetical protein
MEINGKKVVDATSKATIHITPLDATKGANKDPAACAAARAAKRDITDCLSARVHIGRVYVEHKNKWVRYFTPDALRTEIIAFDRGGTFQPGDYTLMPPSPRETEEARKSARSKAQREKDRSFIDPNRPNHLKRARKTLKVAKIKRHEVTGIRPKGANI